MLCVRSGIEFKGTKLPEFSLFFLWLAWNKFQQNEKKAKQSWKQWRRVKRKSEIFCVSFGCSPPEKKSYCVYIFILNLHSYAAVHNQKLMQSHHRRIKTNDDDSRERKVYKTFFADFWDYLKISIIFNYIALLFPNNSRDSLSIRYASCSTL